MRKFQRVSLFGCASSDGGLDPEDSVPRPASADCWLALYVRQPPLLHSTDSRHGLPQAAAAQCLLRLGVGAALRFHGSVWHGQPGGMWRAASVYVCGSTAYFSAGSSASSQYAAISRTSRTRAAAYCGCGQPSTSGAQRHTHTHARTQGALVEQNGPVPFCGTGQGAYRSHTAKSTLCCAPNSALPLTWRNTPRRRPRNHLLKPRRRHIKSTPPQ